MMVGGVAVHQTQHFLTPVNHTKVPQQRQQEQFSCFPPLHKIKNIEEFKRAHAQYIKLGLDRIPRHAGDLLLACALSEWSSMDYAQSIFLALDDPMTFDFNTIIRGSIKHGDPEAALQFYEQMLERAVEPDNYTYPFAIKASSQLSAAAGLQIHGHAVKLGFQSDVIVQNSLISMYGKFGEIEASSRIFERMESGRTIASWSALLAAHTRMGLWRKCLELFANMTAECLRPDESSAVCAASSCKNLGLNDPGRSIHCFLLRNFSELNVIVQTSLIDMYINCGNLEKGMLIFDRMTEKNAWTYSTIISGLAMHGEGERALKLLSNMLEEGFEPDEAVYVGVLSACSHAGLLEQGLQCFDRMRFEHQIMPNSQHYGCMVDLLARAGKLKEAYELIGSMPMGPTDAAWRSLLSACKTYKDLELAECAIRNLELMNAQNSGDYINLSNMYAKARRWNDAAKIRTEMVDKRLFHAPGFSTVEVKGKMHTFVSQDRSHPQSEEVYEMLYQMEWQLKFEGYIPDASEMPLDARDEEKRQLLSAQSQKLAIAFALLNTSQGSAIRIISNLRMSKDCHTYTALISSIFDRQIVVRDRNRFHIFRRGVCKCRDFW